MLPLPCALASPTLFSFPSQLQKAFLGSLTRLLIPPLCHPSQMTCRVIYCWWSLSVCLCPGGSETRRAGSPGSPCTLHLQAVVWALPIGNPENCEHGFFSSLPFQATGLHFRHTDNINFWLSAIAHVGLPSVTLGSRSGLISTLHQSPQPHPCHTRALPSWDPLALTACVF